MPKYDFTKFAAELKDEIDESLAHTVGIGSDLPKLTPNDFLVMPDWWQKATRTLGLPYGHIVMIAGDSDSGKTTTALEAMREGQAQDFGIIYVETEGKTSEKDLLKWGIDPKGVVLLKTIIIEKAYMALFEAWDKFRRDFPDGKLLIVFDSIGNVVSQRDDELDMTTENEKPGGLGKTNRRGLGRIKRRMEQEAKVAALVINYTYDNLGSPGKTNAGGKSINFYSSLTYQTSRKSWLEKTVKGQAERAGVEVQWTLFKNHIDKDNPGPKKILLEITGGKVEFTGAQ